MFPIYECSINLRPSPATEEEEKPKKNVVVQTKFSNRREFYHDVKFITFEKHFLEIVKNDGSKNYHKITDILSITETA
jgi:hypothetical protein